MTTAQIWDEGTNAYVSVGEEGVRKLRHTAFDDEDVTIREQAAARGKFFGIVQSYIAVRKSYDQRWKDVPSPDYDSEAFTVSEDDVVIEWKEYRCGDHDHYRREFPLSDLWLPDWEAAVQAEVAEHERKKVEKDAVEKVRLEKSQLMRLLAKYGVPPEYHPKADLERGPR